MKRLHDIILLTAIILGMWGMWGADPGLAGHEDHGAAPVLTLPHSPPHSPPPGLPPQGGEVAEEETVTPRPFDTSVLDESADGEEEEEEMGAGNGDRVFPLVFEPATYSLGGFPRAATIVDIDSDGDLDIVVTNPENHNIVILLNRGDGAFEKGEDFPVDGYPIAVISRDIDNDSDMDLIILDSDGRVRIFRHEGGATPTLALPHQGGGDEVSSGGEGKGAGKGVFTPAGSYPVAGYSFSISAPDVDRDGDDDLIVLSAKKTYILLNDGKGGFNTTLDYKGNANSSPGLTVDLNLDERGDMVIGDKEGISVLLNTGDTFARGVYYATGKKPIAMAAGDIDSDLDEDLFVANYTSHTVSILRNNGEGAFEEPQNLSSGKGPTSVSLGDLDWDEDLDIVVTNGAGGDVTVFINNTVRPLSITTESLPQGRNGQFYETKLEVMGGLPPYNWSIVSGALPPSLHLDPQTGELVSKSRHGEPHSLTIPLEGEGRGETLLNFEPPCLCLRSPTGLYRFTVQAEDSSAPAAAATAELYIEVLPQPGTVSGTIRYSGEKEGVIRIGLRPGSLGLSGGIFIGSGISNTTLTTPGEYRIENIYPETYLVSAFLDVNSNGIMDVGEPYGVYGLNGRGGKGEAVVVDGVAELTGIDIELRDE